MESLENNDKIISDKPIINKSTLTVMDNGLHIVPKSIKNDFGSKLINHIIKTYGMKVFNDFRVFNFRDKRYVSSLIVLISSPLFTIPKIILFTFMSKMC